MSIGGRRVKTKIHCSDPRPIHRACEQTVYGRHEYVPSIARQAEKIVVNGKIGSVPLDFVDHSARASVRNSCAVTSQAAIRSGLGVEFSDLTIVR